MKSLCVGGASILTIMLLLIVIGGIIALVTGDKGYFKAPIKWTAFLIAICGAAASLCGIAYFWSYVFGVT